MPSTQGDATEQTPPDLPSYLFKERIVYLVRHVLNKGSPLAVKNRKLMVQRYQLTLSCDIIATGYTVIRSSQCSRWESAVWDRLVSLFLNPDKAWYSTHVMRTVFVDGFQFTISSRESGCSCFLQGMSMVPQVTELVLAELLYLQYESTSAPIYMYINSTGVQVWLHD